MHKIETNVRGVWYCIFTIAIIGLTIASAINGLTRATQRQTTAIILGDQAYLCVELAKMGRHDHPACERLAAETEN